MAGEIAYAKLTDLSLDPKNPRLGRAAIAADLAQDDIYKRMSDWSLEELATSFLESGFWPHEAVLCAKETIKGVDSLVVVEGNRRIAALMRLKKTFDGEEKSRQWTELVGGQKYPEELFESVPYILLENRSDVDAFLGFRHVTGIKEWAPPEKAQFIAKLIDERGMSYRDVMRKIGSKIPVVERNYISYCILVQMETIEDLAFEEVENRFSVLFLSLRSKSVQSFLGVVDKFGIDPKLVNPPISDDKIENLKEYSRWLFGDRQTPPVVKDSREVDRFARVLASDDGLQYLRSVKSPSLEKAYLISGGNQDDVYELVATATYSLQEALSTLHHYKNDERLISISKRLIENTEQVRNTLGI